MTDVLDQFDLSGTVGVITGAGSGIGEAYAEALSEAGANVACIDIDADAATDVAARLETDAVSVEADVTSESDIEQAFDRAVEELGVPDAVFANAGIGGVRRPLAEYPVNEWASVIDVNLTGVFLTAREAARRMIATGDGGTITNTASMYGLIGSITGRSPAYAAAKGGVVNLTREMAVALSRHGIRVNAIAPGFVDTELLDEGLADGAETDMAELKRELESQTLLGRLAKPTDMKAMAVYLAAPASSYVTGQTMVIDGGVTAK